MSEHFDVLIIGAGLSGVGAACHLQRECPDKTYAIVEARHASGGTWDLFRYPGIRSDSDMFTLGYAFKPWTGAKSIADGDSIRDYIRETSAEYDVERHIRYGHRVVGADWCSDDARWTIDIVLDGGERVSLTAGFVHWCSGYYRYDEGFTPEFPGRERFRGEIVHPQHWPEDLDYRGKRVVVIGSGATAVTLIPSMAAEAEHVTMLQRSPTYIVALPGEDPFAAAARRRFRPRTAYSLVRLKNVLMTMLSYQFSRRRPQQMRRLLDRVVRSHLPADYDVEKHFTPSYDPWDQRLCLVPDADLFNAISAGDASVVTDRIRTFTEDGIELESGETLPADLIVTATGLNLQMLGGADVAVDGNLVEAGETIAYKGMMLCGVPNMAMALGYTNASWTLKADLIGEYVCRLLRHMDEAGYDTCVALEPDRSEPRVPILNLNSGYVLRAVDALPKQGLRLPWRVHQNYFRDLRMFRRASLRDEAMRFERRAVAASPAEPELVLAA